MQHWQLALLLLGAGLGLALLVLLWTRHGGPSAPADDEAGEAHSGAGDPRSAASGSASRPEGARAAQTPSTGAGAPSEAPSDLQRDIMRRLQALAFGMPIGNVPDLSGVHGEVAAGVRRMLNGIADKPNYAPRRPLLLPKLMQAMHDDEVSRRELARIIGTDPALAGALLRLANSPFYRIQPEPVESLDRAIALLGLEGMRRLIAAALLQPVFRSSGGLFAKFGEVTWEHSLCSASAAETYAAVLENSDPFAAQLLSLLMGLATMVLFRVATDEYLARQLPANTPLIATLIDSECAQLARQIAASWQLSERIDSALADQAHAAGSDSPCETSLGRSLQAGRLLGALAVLHARHVLDEDAVKAALQTTGANAAANERIWNRLRAIRLEA